MTLAQSPLQAYMPAQLEIEVDGGKLMITERPFTVVTPMILQTMKAVGGPFTRLLGEGVNVIAAVQSKNPFQVRIVSPDVLGEAMTKLVEALCNLPDEGRVFFSWWLEGVTFVTADGQEIELMQQYRHKPLTGDRRKVTFGFIVKAAALSFWSQSAPFDSSLQTALEPMQAILKNIQGIGKSLSSEQKES